MKTKLSIIIALVAFSLGAQEPLDDLTPPTPPPITFPAPAPVCRKTLNAAKASNFVATVLGPINAKPSTVSRAEVVTMLDASNRLDGATLTLTARLTRNQFLSLWDGVTNQFAMTGGAAGKTVHAIRFAETNVGAGAVTVRFRK